MASEKKDRNTTGAGPHTVFAVAVVAGFFVAFFLPLLATQLGVTSVIQRPRAIARIDVNRLPSQQVRAQLEEKIEKYKKAPIQIIFNGKGILITPESIDAKWKIDEAIEGLYIESLGAEKRIFSDVVNAVASETNMALEVEINIEKLFEEIERSFKFQGERARNASLVWEEDLRVVDEQKGLEYMKDEFVQELKERFSTFSDLPVELNVEEVEPVVHGEDIKNNFDQLKSMLLRPIQIKTDEFSVKILLRDHLDWIRLTRVPELFNPEPGSGHPGLQIALKESEIKAFLREHFAEQYDKEPGTLMITFNENQKVHFEGEDKDGSIVEYDEAVRLISMAINEGVERVILPIRKLSSSIIIDEEIRALGIKEALATGHTTYYGSPANRIHNISVGVSKYNGLIIPPGETFSFNKALGKVDGSTGYRKELVIKPEGTIPEYGGGLCQVSTTAYRAALNAGLPIEQRKPHSYAVSYYSQIGGHGIDATIYPGAVDLQFTNDTPGHILIRAYTVGPEAFFTFYGTPDGRSVEMEGPYVYGHKQAPEPLYIKTADLPVGETRQMEKAHNGFQTSWIRRIRTAKGEVKEEKINSTYRAMPAKFLVGSVPEELEPQSIGPEARPEFSD